MWILRSVFFISFFAILFRSISASTVDLTQTPSILSINSTELNVIIAVEDQDEAPLLIFESAQKSGHVYFLRLAQIFEASAPTSRDPVEKINDTELDFERLQWNIQAEPQNDSRPGIVSVALIAQPIPPYSRIYQLQLMVSVNTSSKLNISTANITTTIEKYSWKSTDPSSVLVLLWQMAKFGDDKVDASYLKNTMEARSGDAFFKIGSQAKSQDRTVLVRVQHIGGGANSTMIDQDDQDDEPMGTWVIYNHFTESLTHKSSFGIGTAGGKGGKGSGQRSLTATIALILGSCILVTLAVLAIVWYVARRKARAAAVVRY